MLRSPGRRAGRSAPPSTTVERGAHVVFLTNRVHPRRDNERIKTVRPAVHDAVWEALDA